MQMDLLSLQSILLCLLATLYFFYLSRAAFRKRDAAGTHDRCGFKSYPLLGTLPEFFMNRHRFLDWSTDVLSATPTNSAVFYRPGGNNGVITANPANVEHMLKTRFENYPKGDRFIDLLKDFLGEGIFNSDGELWRIQRKTASYEFNSKSLRNFVMENVTVEIRTRLVPILLRACESGRVLDLQDVLERFAFDNVCQLAFGYDPGCLAGDGDGSSQFMLAFEEATRISSERFMYLFPSIYKLKKFLDVGSECQLRKAIATVHRYADDIIQSRIDEMRDDKAIDEDVDLLSRFFHTDRTSSQFLRDIVISFILAGRDTTSSALTWLFWLLSCNRSVEARILEELRLVRSRNGKQLGDSYTFDDLREMHYLHAAISEAMRLYPPVAVDTKMCLKDDVLPDGTAIKGGWFISYETYAMGRIESIWGKDCREFRPERWLEPGSAVCRQESPFKFPVFHAGPRICLGKDMAYIQMKSIAASVLERFAIDIQEGETHREPLLSLTLRMKGGLPIKVNPRLS